MDYYRNHGTNNDRFLEHLVEEGVLPRTGTCFECGAYDGEESSSTFLLEKKYGWTGVLAEPILGMTEFIARNRPLARALAVAVGARDGEAVEFVEAARWGYSGVKRQLEERSAIGRSIGADFDEWKEGGGRRYVVSTLSLNTIFDRYFDGRGPTVCCLDMEGSEYEALASVDFARFAPLVVTIEGPLCNRLLATHGYSSVRNPFNTDADYEFYFVRNSLLQQHPDRLELLTVPHWAEELVLRQ